MFKRLADKLAWLVAWAMSYMGAELAVVEEAVLKIAHDAIDLVRLVVTGDWRQLPAALRELARLCDQLANALDDDRDGWIGGARKPQVPAATAHANLAQD